MKTEVWYEIERHDNARYGHTYYEEPAARAKLEDLRRDWPAYGWRVIRVTTTREEMT